MGNASQSASTVSGSTVHPHVHGERWDDLCFDQWGTGSSPRAWGTHSGWLPFRRSVRFIPTCMGNASAAEDLPLQMSVHPHVHGERRQDLHLPKP